jgi:YidC/Oxa1 family membrane protein insertase
MKTLIHPFGVLFQPIFHLFGLILAFFYGLVPNYVFAIVMLTIVIMGILTPFTVKSTKSMVSMQLVQPEIKKLQQKYKGVENRQQLNEELMNLYKEHGVNPLGGCLPVLLQAPFLFILYSVIKGLTHLNALGTSAPLYIPSHSKIHDALIASNGHLKVFGMDLSLKTFSHHSSIYAQIPFFALVIFAVGLQYFQMAMINNRNQKSGQPVPPQQLMMQRVMPIFFFYIYVIMPAAVVVYMVVSSVIRILTQYFMFRAGISDPTRAAKAKEGEREIPGKASEKGSSDEKPSTLKSVNQQNRSKAKRNRKAR